MSQKPLVVISLDGVGADLLAAPRAKAPTIRSLMEKGATAARLKTIFPSVTWAIHSTVLTGNLPSRHGVWGNFVMDRASKKPVSYFDVDAGPADGGFPCPTIIDAVRRSGGDAAAVCWPLTQNNPAINWNIPEFYDQASFEGYSTPSFWKELLQKGFPVDQYARISREHRLGREQDTLTCDIVNYVLSEKKPSLLLAHYLLVDSLQHDHGPDAPETFEALEFYDEMVAQNLDCLEETFGSDNYDIVLFSDHGQLPVSQAFNLSAWLKHRNLEGQFVANGGAAFYYAPDQDREKHASRVRDAICGNPCVSRAWIAEEFPGIGLPAPGGCGRRYEPDLALELAPGFIASITRFPGSDASSENEEVFPSPLKGMHGYGPERTGLDGILICHGPAFAERARRDTARMQDLAPTIAKALALKLGETDGESLDDLLAGVME